MPRRNEQEQIFYHGANKTYEEQILSEGLRESTRPGSIRLGPGLYATPDRRVAERAAARHKEGGFTATLAVRPGRTLNVGRVDHLDAIPQGYDSVEAIHPEWHGVWDREFPEINIRDASRARIVALDGIKTSSAFKLERKGWQCTCHSSHSGEECCSCAESPRSSNVPTRRSTRSTAGKAPARFADSEHSQLRSATTVRRRASEEEFDRVLSRFSKFDLDSDSD